jgi:hypothetical protein
MVDPFRLAFDVWAAAQVPLAHHLPAVDIEETDNLIADRSGAATPRVMVFGTYNAGKSTLINALVGKEVARVADHPETDRVTSYSWRGFLLDDTPGIDAPIEHEQVTRAHLETSDAVLFVLATDGALEEKRTFDEIMEVVRAGKPIRIILNNKGGFQPDSLNLLILRNRLADNLRHAAAAAGIDDIETRVPIRLVNAESGRRARLERKSVLLSSSGLLELEADIVELCKATGKAQRAHTVCRRISKQIDLALRSLPANDVMQPFHEASAAVAAERTRLTAILNTAAQESAAAFQSSLAAAVSKQEPELGKAAANEAADAVSAVIKRELCKTQRVFGGIENAFAGPTVAIDPLSGSGIPLPEGTLSQAPVKGGGFSFSDVANLLVVAQKQIDKEAIVGGFMAAKQVFPAAFKGLGPAFFGKIVPFIGPAIQTVTGIYDAYSVHSEAQREFEREKDRRLALAQQVADAGRKMRWALIQQCQELIESVFSPVEEMLARQATTLKGKASIIETDRVMLLQCKGRLEIAMEN